MRDPAAGVVHGDACPTVQVQDDGVYIGGAHGSCLCGVGMDRPVRERTPAAPSVWDLRSDYFTTPEHFRDGRKQRKTRKRG